MFIEEEEVIIAGDKKVIRRLFVQSVESDFGGVGWVINEDIKECMICHTAFGVFRWPHHCRSCGNLVCHPCSPEEVIIEEMKELGHVRICTLCYFGQDPVHVQYHRKSSFSGNDFLEENEDQMIDYEIICTPVFIVKCARFVHSELQNNDHCTIIVYVCIHNDENAWSDDRDFVVNTNVLRRNLLLDVMDDAEELVEIHHVVMKADLFPSAKLDLEKARTKQVMSMHLFSFISQLDLFKYYWFILMNYFADLDCGFCFGGHSQAIRI